MPVRSRTLLWGRPLAHIFAILAAFSAIRLRIVSALRNSLLESTEQVDVALEDGTGFYLRRVVFAQRTHRSKYAIVSHICDDTWLPGILTLGASVKKQGTEAELVALVSGKVSEAAHTALGTYFDQVLLETPLTPHPSMTRKEADCLTLKFRIWQLPFEKVLYMDSDMVALGSQDPLLEDYDELSAIGDAGISGFNSGLMVARPSPYTFQAILKTLSTLQKTAGQGGDQGFLNRQFPACATGVPAPGAVGCWTAHLPPDNNVFTRLLSDEQVSGIQASLTTGAASPVRSIHYSGDWQDQGMKPWGSGCLKASDSLGKDERRHVSLLHVWLHIHQEAQAGLGDRQQSAALFDVKCPAAGTQQ